MTEREPEESSQPRKRIAVACGRCRKRKIRCSGDPGNGGPCSNCKNAGHEPCLFLRVSSTETHMRNDHSGSHAYDVDSTRAGYPSRSAASPLTSQYSADVPGDMRYSQGAYPSYGGKYYTTAVSGWTGAYGDDGVDYSINYSYPHISQDPVHMLPGYRYPPSNKGAIYAEPEASNYGSFGGLVHRPGPSVSDLPNFSLSGMAASLPTPAAVAGRLPSRTLTSSAGYRADGLPSHYSSSKMSSPQDVGYSSINSSFESPVSYGQPSTTLRSSRVGNQSEASAYHSAGSEGIYGHSEHVAYRSLHESDSYIYNDKPDSARRGSQSSGSVLSNGQVYVPEPHTHHHGSASHVYAAIPGSSHVAADTGATISSGAGSAGSVTADSHRRSAGNVRGA